MATKQDRYTPVEEYQVGNIHLYIEDYKDGAPKSAHFFPDHYKERYHCWVNGGGLGTHNTLPEARKELLRWAKLRLAEDIKKYEQSVKLKSQLKSVKSLSKFARK